MRAIMDRVFVFADQLNPMPRGRTAKQNLTRLPLVKITRHILIVGAIQQDTDVAPGMIMKCPIIVRTQKAMQIDIEETIPGDDPPAQQIRIFLTADDEIGIPRRHDLFGEVKQGAEDEAGKFHTTIIVAL